MRNAVVGVILLAFHTASAGKGAAILVPPAEVDVGAGAPFGAAVDGASTEVLAGIHWASLWWKSTPIDIGFGYVGSFRQLVPGYSGAIARETTATDPSKLRLDGAYLDVRYRLAEVPHLRSWISVRTEWLTGRLDHQSIPSHGVALRLASEVWAGVAGASSEHRALGVIAGTFALGLYFEASHRELSPELGPNALTAGISVRVPFILGLVD